ncbi:N-acetylmuramoyl-L-alanine amidase [Halobacillus aidingensis]|uniref:N-acetylmuramoyl-L-alanine amidase n=1 Tax=Halobacillus aidingensis TaxID=240303 RepID=A0A1H0QRP2_HALAD|nr:N-acetylmuramoyl-L-alanine amidase [Halobacillus aidingensis]SDP19419.1 N-acetylmuramoyl-L-alanine amidase [Halobacillus aidingensis]
MKTVVIDAGHGGSDPGATYRGYQEKTFNLSIAMNVQRILSQNYQVRILMTRTTDVTLSLDARTSLANRENADFFLSIHNNAAGGSGFETYIYNGPLSPNTRTYQNIIHDTTYRAIRGYNVRDRGKKRANLYVTRETDMSSLLVEVLFVDNPGDLALLRNSAFINDVSRGIAEGVADALNLPKMPTPAPTPPGDDTLYRVIAGSFRNRENAEQLIESLAGQGFPGFVVPTTISGTTYYRVQTGAFSSEENAKEQVERLKRIGITNAFIIRGEDAPAPPQPEPEEPEDGLYRVIAGSFRNRENAEERVAALAQEGIDGFIVEAEINGVTYYRVQTGAYSDRENAEAQVERLKSIGISGAFIIGGPSSEPDPEPEPEPEPPVDDGGYKILGDMYLTSCQLDAYAKTVNPDAPDLGRFYLKYGEAYGIRGDVAFAQALNETNYFRFTGDVRADQNNYAGIGATGGGVRGATFDTPEEGVHAHIQHLYAYASKDPIPAGLEKVDPRFDLVTRGLAPTWTRLNGRWAVPGDTYGQLILQLHERNINHALEEMDVQRGQLNDVLDEI